MVWVGQKPGIYTTWPECQAQIMGFPNAKYKSFKTRKEAEEAFSESAQRHISKTKKKPSPKARNIADIVQKSISVDAACSRNPGIMEYRGVKTYNGEEIFRKGPYMGGTNNIGEFLALVHALALLKKKGMDKVVIYTDSRTAKSWVEKKSVKTTLKKDAHNTLIFELIDKALAWLKNNTFQNPILKWDTANWGEIPADFGRK